MRSGSTAAWACLAAFAAAAAAIAAPGGAGAAAGERAGAECDWPQFHGPRRDNLSTDRGLLKRWPDGGPKLLWKAAGLGHGYATVAIAGGRIYTAGTIGEDTTITALDLSGRRLWQARNGRAYRGSSAGARATPTVARGKVYHHNGQGNVACLDAASGKALWRVDLIRDFGGRTIRWGLSESVLVDGGRAICSPGGEEIGVVALDADTGRTLWTCTGIGDRPSYASAIVVDHGGLRQMVTMTSASAVGIDIETGRLLWKYPHPVPFEANCASPVYHDGHVALFGTWGRGATLLKLNVDGRRCSVQEVWRTRELDNEHGGVVLVDGCLYGQADGNHKDRHWACLDFKTGRTMYSAAGLPGRSGTLTYADGMLYLLGDRRTVALAPATPEGLNIVSRFELPQGGRGNTWAHPVVCGGRLYLRHGDVLYVYDVRARN